MQAIQLNNEQFWHGHISLEINDDWAQAWRIPFEQRGLFPPEGLQNNASKPAGVRITFYSDTRAVEGEVVAVEGRRPLDICCDGVLKNTANLDNQSRFRFENLPAGEKLIELWLPQRSDFRLSSLRIDDGASLRPFQDTRPKWTTYGSSITHCGEAESPVYTWPAVVARERDLNLTCLGYGGQCHLDSMIARMIRDRPADYISICAGINIYGGSLGPRAFLPALIGSVQIIREKHPTTPLALISPIFSPPREEETSIVGWTLPRMREEVKTAVEILREYGDEDIYYVDGLKLFGPEYSELLPDKLHPNAEGYKQLGRNFLDQAAPILFG
jgi:hypothetical protein